MHWFTDDLALYHADCLTVLPVLRESSIDAIVTDPPYGLEFMGKDWDAPWKHGMGELGYSDGSRRLPRPNHFSTRNPVCQACHKHKRGTSRCQCAIPSFDENQADSDRAYQAWCEVWAAECLRVLRPGGHLVAFGGTRTYHRLVCAVEDAGFEIRDSLHWLYGSGMPKNAKVTLKPSHEPIVLARKPLAGTVAQNVLTHGTGALNIDGCRVEHASEADRARSEASNRHADWGSGPRENHILGDMSQHARADQGNYDGSAGRWPPNVLLTHSADCAPAGTRRVSCGGSGRASPNSGGFGGGMFGDGIPDRIGGGYGDADGTETVQAWDCAPGCPVAALDGQSGASQSRIGKPRKSAAPGDGYGMTHTGSEYGDSGGASRFFPQSAWDPGYDVPFMYQAKAARKERPRIDGMPAHPTVKPIALMRWLVRLVTPPGGIVLDPFAGTGTTLQAARLEGFRTIGIEQLDTDEHPYVRLARKRLSI